MDDNKAWELAAQGWINLSQMADNFIKAGIEVLWWTERRNKCLKGYNECISMIKK